MSLLRWPRLLALALWSMSPFSAWAEVLPATPVVVTDNFQIHGTDGVTAQAKALEPIAEPALMAMRSEIGGESRGPIRVVVDRNRVDMLARANAEQRSHPPEWAAGLAYPARRVIYLHAAMPMGELHETFRHEISHIVFGELPGSAQAPLWFKEGLAIHQSEGFSFERAWLLTEAATVGSILPLSQLNRGFPRGSARAGVAYAQAVHFVGFLKAEYGDARFAELIDALRNGEAFPSAVEARLGASLDAIERSWRSRLEVRWGWLPLITGSGALWGLASVLLVIGWRRRRRQRIARLKAMRASEEVEYAEDITVVHGASSGKGVLDPYDGRPPTYH